jgi:transposase
MRLELDKIRLDGDTQPRESIIEELVKHYTELVLDGVEMTPVTVFFDGKHYWLGDGFHRYHAHKNAGFNDIEVEVINGTRRKAWIFSLSANGRHGMPRTLKDRRNSVMRALNDVELSGKSDRELAKICDVSRMTVGRVRKELELANAPQPEKPETKAETKEEKQEQVIQAGAEAPPPDETYDPKEDMLKEMAAEHQEMAKENAKLKDQLAIKQLPASEDAKVEIETTIKDLRKQVESLDRELRALTLSRNDYQLKNADLLKQVSYWKRRAEKAEKAAA